MPDTRILLIEDDPAVSRVVAIGLAGYAYTPVLATTGEAGVRLALTPPLPAVVLLDLGLPDGDGLAVCTRIRAVSAVPIIILTARGAEPDKVLALESGADDYITKPFGLDELLARVRVALRHAAAAGAGARGPVVAVGDLQVDLAARQVTVRGTAVHLTPTEFTLLETLVRNAGRVSTHRQLLAAIRGAGYGADTPLLRVYIAQLRAKVEAQPAAPRYIRTEPGIGYRFAAADDAAVRP
ncbi:MAG TPA: response regulator transcription factor [Chloroflexia bacterium]|nr:response regulator transcription factor [Chloroflexia bacterium]